MTTPTDAGAALSETPLREVRETAVCPRSFSDLLGRRVTLADLAAHPLISLSADSASYGLYAALFAASGLPFCPEIEAATADQLLPLVEAELGVAFLPEAFLSAADPARVAVPELEQTLPPRHRGHTVKPAWRGVACALRCRIGRSVGAAGKKSRRTHDIFIFPPLQNAGVSCIMETNHGQEVLMT